MLYSEKYKVQWWRVMRNASRTLEEIPIRLSFTEKRRTHECIIENSSWPIVLCCRNPYSRAVSFWQLRHNTELYYENRVNFETFLKNENEYFNQNLVNPIEPITILTQNPDTPKYIIRFENMYGDLMKIPFIIQDYDKVSDILDRIRFNPRRYKEQYVDDITEPYHTFYTQELADIVWENKQYEFEYWGYSRDSWKTLMN